MTRPKVKAQDFVGKAAYLAQRSSAAGGRAVHADRRRPGLGQLGRGCGTRWAASRFSGRTASVLTDARGRTSYVTSAGLGPVGRQAHPAQLPASRARRRGPQARGRVSRRAVPGHGGGRRVRRRCSTRRTSGSGADAVEICVCVKRVPMVGGTIVVTPDGLDVDTSMTGFTVSPHEECAVEEAVQITERLGGSVTVLTLGPAAGGRPAARHARARRQPGDPAADRRRRVGPGRDRRRDRRRGARRDRASTCCCSATRRPTRAGTRCRCGWRTRSGLPCVTGIKRLEIADGADGDPARILASREYRGRRGGLRRAAARRGQRQGRHQPAAVPVAAWAAARQARHRSRRSSSAARQPTGCTRSGCGFPRRRASGAEVLGPGVEAVPALVAAARRARGAAMTVLCLVETDAAAASRTPRSARSPWRAALAGVGGRGRGGGLVRPGGRRSAPRSWPPPGCRRPGYAIGSPALAGYAPLAWARALAGLAADSSRAARGRSRRCSRRPPTTATRCSPISPRSPACRWRRTASQRRRSAPGRFALVRQRWAGSLLEDAVLESPLALLTVAADAVPAELRRGRGGRR